MNRRSLRSGSSLLLVTALLASLLCSCSKARKDAISLTNKGVQALDRGGAATAYDYFRQATQVDPEFAPGFYHLGLVQYHDRKELQDARASFVRSLELSPGDAEALYQLGRLHADLSQPGDARRYLGQALATDAEHAGAHYVLGLLAEKDGDLHEADSHFRQAVTFDPAHTAAFSSLAQLYERVVADDAAMQVYREAIRHNRYDVSNRELLASLLMRRGRAEDALELLVQAYDLDPARQEILFSIGSAYLATGNDRDAETYLNRYLAIQPEGVQVTPPNAAVARVLLDNLKRKGVQVY